MMIPASCVLEALKENLPRELAWEIFSQVIDTWEEIQSDSFDREDTPEYLQDMIYEEGVRTLEEAKKELEI